MADNTGLSTASHKDGHAESRDGLRQYCGYSVCRGITVRYHVRHIFAPFSGNRLTLSPPIWCNLLSLKVADEEAAALEVPPPVAGQ
jgi:hypothetical protein